MSRIVRWDPFREMVSVRNQMDHLVGDLLREPTGLAEQRRTEATSAWRWMSAEDDHNYSVKASLPGIDPADLDVSYSENTLTIQGERRGGECGRERKVAPA